MCLRPNRLQVLGRRWICSKSRPHPLDLDAQARVVGDRGLEEGHGIALSLGHQNGAALRALASQRAMSCSCPAESLENHNLHRWIALRWSDRATCSGRPDGCFLVYVEQSLAQSLRPAKEMLRSKIRLYPEIDSLSTPYSLLMIDRLVLVRAL